jgi:putative membrane protein insertion efficiency factor
VNAAQHILSGSVRLYRWVLSPAKDFIFGPFARCRFTPSCSLYALGAIQTHGAWRGTWLTVKRISRCHPWGACGDDPVPGLKSTVHSPQSTVHSPALHGS